MNKSNELNLTKLEIVENFQICAHCKRKGANIGCWHEVTPNSNMICDRSYHVDCGMQRGATFVVSSSFITLSKCFMHSDIPELYVFCLEIFIRTNVL